MSRLYTAYQQCLKPPHKDYSEIIDWIDPLNINTIHQYSNNEIFDLMKSFNEGNIYNQSLINHLNLTKQCMRLHMQHNIYLI